MVFINKDFFSSTHCLLFFHGYGDFDRISHFAECGLSLGQTFLLILSAALVLEALSASPRTFDGSHSFGPIFAASSESETAKKLNFQSDDGIEDLSLDEPVTTEAEGFP